jgi:hypothetical protein
MATFYVLPPRALLDDILGGFFTKLLPGLPLPLDTWDAVTERFATSAGWPADVFLIPCDDLPPDQPVDAALQSAFGAEPGDRVIEVRLNGGTRAWAVPGGVSALAAAR